METNKNLGYYFALFIINNLVSLIPIYFLRRLIYVHIYRMKIAKGAFVGRKVKFFSPWKIDIGQNAFINNGCLLDGRKGIMIGRNVNLSWNVNVWTLQHDPDDKDFGVKGGDVSIDEYAWIATGATILPNIKIGRGAVIGAESVVTKDVDDFEIVAGNPARFIRKRSKNIEYELSPINLIDWAI